MRIVVDLPAPFGPRKPVTLPGSTSKVRPSTARTAPYSFVSPRTWIMLAAQEDGGAAAGRGSSS
jgi:hypothetical protein